MSENLFGLTVAADKGLDDLQCQRLLSENRRYQEVMLQYRCALKALESRLEILNEEFSLQHDRNPIESMKSRLKSPSSIMNKMQKRGLSLDFPTMQANIMDVAGGDTTSYNRDGLLGKPAHLLSIFKECSVFCAAFHSEIISVCADSLLRKKNCQGEMRKSSILR